jgi:hypothetical protein
MCTCFLRHVWQYSNVFYYVNTATKSFILKGTVPNSLDRFLWPLEKKLMKTVLLFPAGNVFLFAG